MIGDEECARKGGEGGGAKQQSKGCKSEWNRSNNKIV
jgi:hypothetical protein